jgi:nitrogen fixation protein FixH
MKLVLALIAALAFAAPAAAQHSHGAHKGPNGGPVEDVAGVHAELVVSGATITINVMDEDNKPLPTKGYTATVLVVAGGKRETVTLAPSGESALKGDAKAAVAKGAAITVTLKTSAAKSGQAKYKL